MQNIGAGQAASKLSVNINIIGIEDISDPHFCCYRLGTFIDGSSGGMAVAVDESRGDMFSAGINDHGAAPGYGNIGCHLVNFTIHK